MELTSAGSASAPFDSVLWKSKRGEAAGLEDISGQLRLQIAGAPAGVLKVEHGAVEIAPDGDAPALLAVDTPQTLLAVLGGESHPFVAYLQGHLRIEGDRALALRIAFGLQAGSPWSGLTPRS
jgi:putative sterol carrier protein